ncbi:DUF2911 domain-containing protein [Segetibacter sp. 3557_3]|uniref:DUF2911 domain-containing protein n=1 Tax=Segetibacter sp. 3557_3 TaxID=2547429 RepID=UPI00105842A0|nr:DUF2911 domain-containing protein [Segetibacter sp. 3557_3]TDH20900.1 DUF2911 domain-containing protein [Segetibacter sp. 3557_3]
MRTLVACIFILCAQLAIAQQKPTDLDQSPMDMSYWPANYPILKMRSQITQDPVARVIYSRPLRKGRTIFGTEVKYNEVWRMGANEATEIEVFKNVKVAGKRLLKGRYTMFCIPEQSKWTVIFNKDLNTWGSFTYRPEKDALRVDVPAQPNTQSVEALTIYFEGTTTASNMHVQWDTMKAAIPFSL